MTSGLLLGLGGCASTSDAFSTRFPDNRVDQVNELIHTVEQAPRRTSSTTVVGVSSAPLGLFAYDLGSGRTLWRQSAQMTSAPMLAGSAVVVQEGRAVVGRDISTGQTLFTLDAGNLKLIGADGDAQGTVMTLSEGAGSFAESRVVLVEGQTVAWDRPMPYQVGRPAIAGSVVLLPWSSQYLSGMDRASGEETARIRVEDGVLAQVFMEDGSAYAGSEEGAVRLTSKLAEGLMRVQSFAAAPERELPGRPAFVRNVYRRDEFLDNDSARHSIQLAWAPAPHAAALGLRDDALYLVFYRFVFAFNYPGMELRWVYTGDHDLVGAQAVPGGLVIGDLTGTFRLLDSQRGAVMNKRDAGLAMNMVAMPRNLRLNGSGTTETTVPESLRAQLMDAARDADARLVPVRRLAVAELSALSDAEVTANLLELCSGDRVAPAVRQDACEALARRSTGAEVVLKALEQHYDHLSGTPAPPVGALARAAQQQHLTGAVPALLSQLWDPHTESADLKPIIQTIAQLDPRAAYAPLAAFARLYHADGHDEHLVEATKAAIVALSEIPDPDRKETLRWLAEDGLALRGAQEQASAALATIEQAELAEAQAANARQAGLATSESEGGPPDRLTLGLLETALRPVRRQLTQCLTEHGRNHFSARVVLVVEDHNLQLVSVLPAELQACVEPLVRSRPLPETQTASRQQLIYTLRR